MSIACDICYEFYADSSQDRLPRILPLCGHDFCTRCVELLCRDFEVPQCPKCRQKLFTRRRGSAIDFPIPRGLLEVEARIDLRNGISPLLMQKTIERAPSELLLSEMDARKRLELLQSVPLEILQEEIENRREAVPPPPSSKQGLEGWASRTVAQRRAATRSAVGHSLASAWRSDEDSSYGGQPEEEISSYGDFTFSAFLERVDAVLQTPVSSPVSNANESMHSFSSWRTFFHLCPSTSSTLFRLCFILKRLLIDNFCYLVHQWKLMDRNQRLQLFMVFQALPLLAVGIYVNFASLF